MAEAIRFEEMNEAGQQAAARSQAYAALLFAFDYPDAEFVAAVRSGALAEALRETQGAVDPALAAGEWAWLEDAGASDDDLAVEYTRLFDVGAGGPPCPLYGGLYNGGRMQVMEECVRFYNHFGLTLSEAPRELPDHLATQLEFLHFLAFREAEAWRDGQDPGPWQRAARFPGASSGALGSPASRARGEATPVALLLDARGPARALPRLRTRAARALSGSRAKRH